MTVEERSEQRNHRAFKAIVFMVFLRATGPGVVNYTTERHFSAYVTDAVPRSNAANVVADASSAVLLLVCAWAILRPRRGPAPASGVVLFALGMVVWPLLEFPDLTSYNLLGGLLAILVALALWRTGVDFDDLTWVAIAASAVAAYSIVGGMLAPEHFMFADHVGAFGKSQKALIGSDQLAGPFGHSNTLGLFCVLALPLTGFVSARRVRWGCALLLVFALVWSSSRTGLGALALLVGWRMITSALALRSRARMGVLTLGLVMLAGLLLPFLTKDLAAFTRRGAIWAVSIENWEQSRWIGNGLDWYVREGVMIPMIGREASSGHNLWVHTLTVAGVFGAFVVLATLLPAMLTAGGGRGKRSSVPLTGFLLVFGAASILEYIWVVNPAAELFPVVGFVFALCASVLPDQGQEAVRERNSSPVSDRSSATSSRYTSMSRR